MIAPGQLITIDDIQISAENSRRVRKNAVTEISDTVGKRAVRRIQAGQIILSNMIEYPPLIKKGGRVLIKAENDEIRITATGKALENGKSGEQVRVINITSGKEIFATVTGPGVVEVFF